MARPARSGPRIRTATSKVARVGRERQPVTNRVQFQRDGAGQVTGLTWQRTGDAKSPSGNAIRVPLREEIVTFPSGELTLRGKLILPEGQGPFPVMIPVHGSEDYSAVDHYSDPYIYAANGIAAFVYDKRGTGGSTGTYTANFDVLSDDTVAAAQYVRKRPEIDGDKVHLAGYSQGGWIAPLAALKDGHIRSVFVGFGVAVPVLGEDRWGYVYALQQKGFGDKEIAEMDSIAAILGDIVDRGQNRWSDFSRAVKESKKQALVRDREAQRLHLRDDRRHRHAVVGRASVPVVEVRSRRSAVHRSSLRPGADTGEARCAESVDLRRQGLERADAVERRRVAQAAGRQQAHRIFHLPGRRARHHALQAEGRRRARHAGYEDGYFRQQLEWYRKQSGLL